MKYNKLVRDRIPEIIEKKGGKSATHIASEDEYWKKLKEKLGEEANEFCESESEEELADILEIINAICNFKKINMNNLEELRKEKKEKRGGFDRKIILEES
jgi:predicted house-cleaning noncanonical NTP pyrophosphatase (MazG superfamily)